MHYPEVTHDAVLPLVWTPTRGNNIPPYAVPFCEWSNGNLYIARGLLSGEMRIGTTSYTSSEGARLYDAFGRGHAVFEYEVLTCASRVRFHLEGPQPLTPAEETPRTPGPRVLTTGPAGPSPRTAVKLAPFSWHSPVHGQPATTPNETGEKYANDPPPYGAPMRGWIEPPKHSQPVALSRREDVQFERLASSKCFVLIDDTTSMQYSWSQTRVALAGLVDILSSNAKWDGFNVRFIHYAQDCPCVKAREDFESFFNSITLWRGEKVMAAKVTQVFEESLPLICEPCAPRPVNLLIVTDGIAADTQELFNAMVCCCQKLNEKCVPPHMFRIHILQMGEDRKAVQPLHDLRNRITQHDRDRRILNVVSFHRGRGPLNAQNMFKLLLASTYVSAGEDPDVGERLPPEMIGAQFHEVERIRMMGRM